MSVLRVPKARLPLLAAGTPQRCTPGSDVLTLRSHIRLRVAVPSVVQLIFFLTEVFLIMGAMASC